MHTKNNILGAMEVLWKLYKNNKKSC